MFKMKRGQRQNRLACCMLVTSLLGGAFPQTSLAAITGPYTVDANTLALYHFDELPGAADPGNPIANQVLGGSSLNLTNTGGPDGRDNTGAGGYGASALAGFGTSFDVLASGNNTFHTGSSSVGGGLVTAGTITQASLQGADGAFTYEALVLFKSTILGVAGTEQHLMAHDGGTNRGFLFRTTPTGNLSLYNGSSDTVVAIPMTGDNAFALNEWFHVAVTYNGDAGVAGNLSFYWTRVGANPDAANLIGTGTLTSDLSSLSDINNFGIGTTTRSQFRTELNGLIDEVRISSIARGPDQFAFQTVAAPEPGTWLALGLAGSLGCLYVRRKKIAN